MFKRKFFSFIMILVIIFSVTVSYADDNLIISSWIIDSKLKDNGDLYIIEDLEFDFKDDFNGVYRDIILHSTDGIENLQVFELVDSVENPYGLADKAKEGDSHVYTIKSSKKRISLQIFSPTKANNNKTFRLKYNVKNVASLHEDTGELYYRFVGKENKTFIEYLSATIELPGENKDRTKIFAHGPVAGNINFVQDNLIKLETASVPRYSNIEGRILFPEDFIPNSTNKGKSSFDKIMKEEQNYIDIKEEQARSSEKKRQIQERLSLGLSVGAILLISFFHKITRKKPEIFQNLESVIPDHISPAELRIFTNSGIIDVRAIMATVFDLARRGFIEIEEFKSEKDRKEFAMTKIEKSDKDLLPHEIHFIHWIFSEVGNGKKVSTVDIAEYRKKSYRSFSTNFTSWNNKVKSDLKSRGYFDHNLRMGATALILSVGVAAIGIITLVFGVLYGLLPLALSMVLIFFSIKLFTNKSDKGYVQYKLWMDYKKSLQQEIDLIKNYDSIPEDNILIYALALGLPMKNLDSLKDNIIENYSVNHWVYWYFLTNTKGGSSFEDSFNSSFYGSSASSTASSIGGGGGFTSGGGGGAGGGGAGGF